MGAMRSNAPPRAARRVRLGGVLALLAASALLVAWMPFSRHHLIEILPQLHRRRDLAPRVYRGNEAGGADTDRRRLGTEHIGGPFRRGPYANASSATIHVVGSSRLGLGSRDGTGTTASGGSCLNPWDNAGEFRIALQTLGGSLARDPSIGHLIYVAGVTGYDASLTPHAVYIHTLILLAPDGPGAFSVLGSVCASLRGQ